MTFTDQLGKSEQRQPPLEGLPSKGNRPYMFPDRQSVFISARVHPGETPASFTMDGALHFLLRRDDPRAIILRRKYVIRLVPMLNPDGVARGHYRHDTRGVPLTCPQLGFLSFLVARLDPI